MKVYLDNAATSMQKPPEVLEEMRDFMENINANPGRGGYHLSLEAGRKVLEARQAVSDFFSGPSAEQVVFCQNVTMALNMAIGGLSRPGDHILISGMEHNAVYRPVNYLKEAGIADYDIIPVDREGQTDPGDIRRLIRPNTRMLVFSHASNVCGTVFPLEEAARIAREHNIFVVADTAQTAGVLEINIKDTPVDVLAFTGHKHLLGPTGIGGFVIGSKAAEAMQPMFRGGTGSRSHLPEQPDFLPDKFESGTLNTVGIRGLLGGLNYLGNRGLENIRKHESGLTKRLTDGLESLRTVTVYGPREENRRIGTIAFNIRDVDNGELCYVLDREYSIMGRPGLHCSPLGHQALGTFPEGTMRFSVGAFTTREDIEYTLESLEKILEIMD